MSFFIFTNNLDSKKGTIYKIAEDQFYLNNLNINESIYKIIEDSQSNFEAVKYGIKSPVSYNGNTISYENIPSVSLTKQQLNNYVNFYKKDIQLFLDNNKNNPLFNTWQNYYNQLNSLDLNSISYPLNVSLEQYFNNLSQPSLSPLQLP
jgi:hypothetical protein